MGEKIEIRDVIRNKIKWLESTNQENISIFRENILDDLETLYEAKNADYGRSADATFEKFGIDSYLVRMFDKINRIQTLSKSDTTVKVDEKLVETCEDLINYCFLLFASVHTYEYTAAKIMLDEKFLLLHPRHYNNNFDMTIWNPDYVDIIMDDIRGIKLDITYARGFADNLDQGGYRNVRVPREDLPRLMLHLTTIIDNCLTYITSEHMYNSLRPEKVEEIL